MDVTKMNWKIVGLVVGLILLVVVGLFVFLRIRPADPGFRLSRGSQDDPVQTVATYWEITNRRDDPLIVKRVIYNGELDAKPYVAGSWPVRKSEFPIRLTLGESCRVLTWSFWDKRDEHYDKEIIYLDVHTNRGKFRYRPGRGFE